MTSNRLPTQWQRWRDRVDLDEYEQRWKRQEAAGEPVHGEADLVARYGPASVLDAGCGMGRVAIELARRGCAVVGVDLDPDMLDRARRQAPELRWIEGDLVALDELLDEGEVFDVVVLAGNVVPFIEPDARGAAIAACARHLARDGVLLVGYKLEPDWPPLADYDAWCAAAGLQLRERFSTWEGGAFDPAESTYAVSVHARRH